MKTIICKHCNKEKKVKDRRNIFCSMKCYLEYRKSDNGRKNTSEIVKRMYTNSDTANKISIALKVYYAENGTKTIGNKHSEAVGKGTRGKYRKKIPNSILELSTRTVRKILHRLNKPCSRCGWNEEVGDIHHIHGKKIKDADNHDNLSYICPNCHRLATRKKIQSSELKSIKEYIGDEWKKYYYG